MGRARAAPGAAPQGRDAAPPAGRPRASGQRIDVRPRQGRLPDPEGADFGQACSALERRFDALWAAAVGAAWPSRGIGGLRLWFVAGAVEAGQPPDSIAAVVGLFRPAEGARPKPTWGQRRACVEAVQLPAAMP